MTRAALILPLLLAGCAGHERSREFASLHAQVESICEIMADPSRYVGRRIMVRGTYWQTPHERLLVDNNCNWSFTVSHSSYLRHDPGAKRIVRRLGRIHPTVRARVIYSGMFESQPIIIGCTSIDCFHYHLGDAQLLAALPRQEPR